jgi:hypothetical protein
MTAELLTSEDVANLLGIAEEQVKRRTKAEGWPCVRFSRKLIRYRAEHVEQIIAMHEDTDHAVAVGLPGQTVRSRRRSA